MASVQEYYRYRKFVLMGSDFFSAGGAWRSIYLYFCDQEARGEPVHLVDLRGSRRYRQFLAAALFSPRILVNGLSALSRLSVLFLCLVRPDVMIYLHETRYYLEGYRNAHPWRARLLGRVLRRNPILCVSQQAADLYRQDYGATRTHVVFECPGGDTVPELAAEPRHIIMVGSMDERKGVDLFSRVADLAATEAPDWRFHWVGGLATRRTLYRSERVHWHGWQWRPADLVRQADLFFLSSMDDPCPLAALEALSLGMRCVAFSQTGIAELIEGIGGCSVYSEHTVPAAFAALTAALSADLDEERLKERMRKTVSLEAFTDHMAAALQA